MYLQRACYAVKDLLILVLSLFCCTWAAGGRVLDGCASWPVTLGLTCPARAAGNFYMDIDAPTGVWNITLRGVQASDVLAPSIHLAPTGAPPPWHLGYDLASGKWHLGNGSLEWAYHAGHHSLQVCS